MFCKEKPAGTVASHAWPFLLRRIRLEALSYRRRMPEKRNTSKHTKCVDNFFYGKSASGREAGFLRPVRAPDGTGFDAADRSAWTYARSRSGAQASTAVVAGAVQRDVGGAAGITPSMSGKLSTSFVTNHRPGPSALPVVRKSVIGSRAGQGLAPADP
jgi:hypothetical protein